MPTKTLYETFTEEQHQELAEVKGDRTWQEAILEEFGVGEAEA